MHRYIYIYIYIHIYYTCIPGPRAGAPGGPPALPATAILTICSYDDYHYHYYYHYD